MVKLDDGLDFLRLGGADNSSHMPVNNEGPSLVTYGTPGAHLEGDVEVHSDLTYNFDRVFENVSCDFGWDPDRSRNISLDIRFVLWHLESVMPAPRLISEMGVR